MGLFDGRKVKALTRQVQLLQNRNLGGLLNTGANVNRNIAIWPDGEITTHAERYCTIDDVYSVVKRIADTAALVPLYPYLVKPDEPARKAHKMLTKLTQPHLSVRKSSNLQLKALEDLPDTDKLAELLENPHPDMSKYEFRYALHTFLLLFGECFLLKQRPETGVNQGLPVQLHFMFPQFVQIRVTETFPRKIVSYDYRVDGALIFENIQPSEVIHIKYFNPEMDYMGSELRGLSPLAVLKKTLTRMESNLEVSVAQMQNGGVPGIVYEKNIDVINDVDIIGSRKDNFYRYLQNSANKGAPFFAAGEMGYIELGLKLADLEVADLGRIDFKKLCNAYGISDRLFNNDATGSEVSDDNAHQSLYTNAVLPNVYRERNGLKKGLLEDFEHGVVLDFVNDEGEADVLRIKGDGKKRDIREDLSEITALQEDITKQTTALVSAWWLTPNEKRELMKYELFEDPLFDQPLLPSGLMTMEDLKMIEPIDNNDAVD